jgi:beta-carotene ketolase (CrtW type)
LSPATRRGLLLAALILGGWLLSLLLLLGADWGHWSPMLLLLAVLLRSQLQTGLFIVGHDAMHRVLLPAAPRLNDRIGALVLGLYAALPFDRCLRQHQRHHRAPGTALDPDFHGPGQSSVLAWYGRFMARYLSPGQMSLLLTAWALLAWCSSVQSVLLFCTLPLMLSSLQLFLVGTVLPHRRGAGPELAQHTRSLALPEWLSLLACYHFGYHLEHHQAPQLAWHELPRRHREGAASPLAPSVFAQ